MITDPPIDEASIFEEYYERASTGKRFANYLIDVFLFYLLIFILFFVIAYNSPPFVEAIQDDSPGTNILANVFAVVSYGLYMSVIEAIFKGKTLGKLITKTRAVNLDGTQISVSTAFGRGFSKAVPFCAFSAFGKPCDPWQDRWTKTMVVNEKR